MFEWLTNFLKTSQVAPAASPQISLAEALAHYEQSLHNLDEDAERQLAVLLARDQVDHILRQAQPVSASIVQKIGDLDQQLRPKSAALPAEQLSLWRDILHPSETSWWWWGDKKSIERIQQNNLIWEVVTGTFLFLTLALLPEIFKRLWDGAPDVVSVFGTLLTLLLTASPLVKQGRQIVSSILKAIFKIKLEQQPHLMTFMSLTALLLILVMRLWFLPYPLTTYYNNMGVDARVHGNIQQAQDFFQRAAALNPDRVVPYYNIAEAYGQIGFSKQAEAWYQKAIERDANFAPAYRGLGQVHNENGDFAAGERLLMAGLQAVFTSDDKATVKSTNYELLANLGWSYFGQNKLELAKTTLLEALTLEPELKTLGDAQGLEYRLALPHFYLAQIYEQAGDLSNARQQWEDCLRFLDAADVRQRERILIAQAHLKNLPTK